MVKRSGFSLAEILLVIGMIVVLGLVSIYGLSSSKHSTSLNAASQQMQATLRKAQSNSVLQLNNVAWGVHFENATYTQPFYALFTTTYSAATTIEHNPLPPDVLYATSTVPQGSSVDILFSPIAGTTQSTTIILYVRGNAAKKATITVDALGSIQLN